jgi:hypothetical protein
LVVSTDICSLKKEEVIRGVIDARVTYLEARCGVERDIQAHRDVVDDSILGHDTTFGNGVKRVNPIAKRMRDGLASRLLEKSHLFLNSGTSA